MGYTLAPGAAVVAVVAVVAAVAAVVVAVAGWGTGIPMPLTCPPRT